jgi:hypothetical protein
VVGGVDASGAGIARVQHFEERAAHHMDIGNIAKGQLDDIVVRGLVAAPFERVGQCIPLRARIDDVPHGTV